MRQLQRDDVARRLKKRIEIRYGKDVPTYPGYSGNISKTGMMVRTTRVFGPGTILKVEVKAPDRTFLLSGRVKWARAGSVQLLPTGRVGMGIRFLEPSEEFVAWLSEGRIGESRVSG
jgi:hypothetical protein